jgi:transmembrane sensor
MSEAGDHDAATPASSAMVIEAQAAEWLRRRHFWNWSADDEAALEIWLAQSLAHRVAYWRLGAALSRTERLAILRAAQRRQYWPARGRRWPGLFQAFAASILVTALGIAAVNYLLRPREQTFSTAIGGHRLLTLADGTNIELNTDTRVRVLTGGGKRTVWLDKGEAFFQVRHDPAHPFVVIAGKRRITDIGTKFEVRRDADRLRVAVLEGKVRFGTVDGGGQAPALLTRGDVAVATPSTLFVSHQSQKTLNNDLGWRNGMLVFHHTTLAAAAAEFNRYNARKLVITDRAVSQMTINGTFHVGDVAAFIRLARDVFGLNIRQKGQATIISQ